MIQTFHDALTQRLGEARFKQSEHNQKSFTPVEWPFADIIISSDVKWDTILIMQVRDDDGFDGCRHELHPIKTLISGQRQWRIGAVITNQLRTSLTYTYYHV